MAVLMRHHVEASQERENIDPRLVRILHRRRSLVWDPTKHDGKVARSILTKSGILLIEEVLSARLCNRIHALLPRLKPLAPTRVIEPSHRQDLLLYPGGYVSEALDLAWTTIMPFMHTVVGRDPDLLELSSMVSFPGAAQQAPHPDVHQSEHQTSMYSVFIPLTDQTYEMGPLLAWPGTHYGEPPELPMSDVVPMMAPAGSLIVMDSKLYHCGGENRSDIPRPVMYFTFKGPGPLPEGSTLSLLTELKGSKVNDLRPNPSSED